MLEALRGRTEAARRMIATSRRMVEELGITQRFLEADVFAGIIELLEGDAVAAERLLRDAYEGLRRQGLGIDAAQAAALLGRALLAVGKASDAEALSHASEALAGDDLKAAIAWRGVRAEALARRGEHAEAVALARAAVDIAAATDALLDHADARLALAAALRAAGRADEASAEELRAIDLWEAKGASLLAERARRAVGGPRAGGARGRGAGGRVPGGARRAADVTVHERRRARHRVVQGALARARLGRPHGDESPAATLDDRRRLMRLELSGEDYVTHVRLMFATRFARWETDLLATRGDRLALFRAQWEGNTRGVEATAEFLWMLEVDDEGRRKAAVMLDIEDVEAAYAELDDRWVAGEGAPYADLFVGQRAFKTASEARDWRRGGAPLPDDFTLRSHRRIVGVPSAVDRSQYLATRGTLEDLELHGRMRVDHVVRIGPKAAADVMTWYGTLGGGEFEDQFVRVYDHDGRRAHHVEISTSSSSTRRWRATAAGGTGRFRGSPTRRRGCWSAALGHGSRGTGSRSRRRSRRRSGASSGGAWCGWSWIVRISSGTRVRCSTCRAGSSSRS